MLLLKVKQKNGSSLMFMIKKLAHLTLWIFFQFAVVILLDEQSTSIEIYDWVVLTILLIGAKKWLIIIMIMINHNIRTFKTQSCCTLWETWGQCYQCYYGGFNLNNTLLQALLFHIFKKTLFHSTFRKVNERYNKQLACLGFELCALVSCYYM